MNLLFVHQNCPGQFVHLAPELARLGHQVRFMTMRQGALPPLPGVEMVRYQPTRGTSAVIHPWLSDFESKVIRGEAAFRKALELRQQGYRPDAIVAHPGWGESLFLKEVWPYARLGIYAEYFYRSEGADIGFDPEFSSADVSMDCRLTIKNLSVRMHTDLADRAWSPTQWQANGFPEPLRSKITVMHDGIDTHRIAPKPGVVTQLPACGLPRLTREGEWITFVNRNLEPMRGYHVFMRALPQLLRRRPNAHVLIIGGEGVSYGPSPTSGSWCKRFADEAQQAMTAQDWARVHFLGRLPHSSFIEILQVSTVHVYLTYPFVLSWSLIEAMSAGCAIVASDVAPVREAIDDGVEGALVPFFDRDALVDRICDLLDDPDGRARLGGAARARATARYDLKTRCLPQQLAWVDDLLAAG